MTSIINLFSNFNDLTKTKSVTDNVSNYDTDSSNSLKNTPSISQGIKFKKYKGKIINNLGQQTNLIEGFDNLDLDKNGLTQQTNNVISNNNFSSQKQTIDNLKREYENTLKEYNKLSTEISENTTRYIDRVNPNNPYLGKVIKFQDGNLSYVTMQGVAKWFPTQNSYINNSGKNGFPPEGQFITVPLEWSNNYQTPGATIPTTPSLISGTPIEDGKAVGNEGTNIYVSSIENKELVNELAYIDENSERHIYPSQNQKYSNSYTQYNGFDSDGNDIPGASYGDSSVEKCKTSCNSIDNCAGFAISNNVCYPKSSIGTTKINNNVNLYSRNKIPKTPPIGVPETVTNVDSIIYYKYKNGGKIEDSYGLAKATSAQKSQLSEIQSRLNLLTNEINKYTTQFDNGANLLNTQATKNVQGLGDYLKDYQENNNNIKNFNTNIENILKDSDITVLQKNYDYLFWGILTVGTVLITMNIVKNK